jgi:hypothetical protein
VTTKKDMSRTTSIYNQAFRYGAQIKEAQMHNLVFDRARLRMAWCRFLVQLQDTEFYNPAIRAYLDGLLERTKLR